MAYPESVLADDEEVVAHLHPHWITLVPATLWFLVICAAAGAGIAYLPTSGTAHSAGLITVLVLAVVLLAWLVLRRWLFWRTTHYVLTTHRVLIRRGLLTHRGRDIALQRISDVAFEQSLFERVVRSGTIEIESSGESGQDVLRDIPRSVQVQQMLNRLIEEDGRRRAREARGIPASAYDAGVDSPTQVLPTGRWDLPSGRW